MSKFRLLKKPFHETEDTINKLETYAAKGNPNFQGILN